MTEFKEFPKIARLFRPVIVTEKIDGTNAQILIRPARIETTSADSLAAESIPDTLENLSRIEPHVLAVVDGLAIFAGQRTKFCTPDKDNFGFAAWVKAHAEELALLGPGHHFGEWWGAGIQRRYGLTEKRFSLFNVGRWYDVHGTNGWLEPSPKAAAAPACCYVVPVLAAMERLDTVQINDQLERLRTMGSAAAPGFKPAEGIVAFHAASGALYKATCEKDEEWKGKAVVQA